mmetsp:Transcript_11315/g.17175  ORF Transcript_11315/g.17175 Transcript_11315/m.17175 type:complete len:167 (+) Transcript_11315:112-612(+)|eukprot:CAMPEP_0202712872 /NCGR_PEP_ID=MMETSP1385-20130828/47000_1 /ASSEMBLY_ACC=CAM_ASM_000861 /TAXON_ID=933848 /ORGANISM="Elphidium margaritaceum" /LENGTH=166 /DNA_ID=CAMNT_0049373043 /DNA_START=63 /DNA_END=563 /DNA_ORIENTATION=+
MKHALRRLTKEYKEFDCSRPDLVLSAVPLNDDPFHCTATIRGPANTPYDGGVFNLEMIFPTDYPFKPPRVKFLTKIYHCNINETGGICLDVLMDNWSPALTIPKILLSIVALLSSPNAHFLTDDEYVANIKDLKPTMIERAKLYNSNKAQYEKIAKEWTLQYAKPQ